MWLERTIGTSLLNSFLFYPKENLICRRLEIIISFIYFYLYFYMEFKVSKTQIKSSFIINLLCQSTI